MRVNVIAGRGSEAFFKATWRDYLDRDREIVMAVRERRWHDASGTLVYVVVGRRRGF